VGTSPKRVSNRELYGRAQTRRFIPSLFVMIEWREHAIPLKGHCVTSWRDLGQLVMSYS